MSSDDDASLVNSTCLCARSELDNYVFPFDAHECGWAKEGRAFCYALLLLYLFIGVAVVSDVFMGAIEGITSKTRIIKLDGKRVEVKVWNDTVANLSLMALGSSAPEILLSCVELAAKGFRVGALGPATIVGSASFNLFMISGICVVSVDTPKRVKEMQVFGVTAFISLFAYTWLVLMLVVFSPGRIQIWEGVVTFLCFPALLVISYAADKRILNKKLAETLRASRGLQRRASLGLSAALGGGGLQRQATIKLSSGLARGGMQRKTNRRLHEQKAAVSAAASARTPVEQIGTTTNGTALTAKQANGDAATAAAPASSTTTAVAVVAAAGGTQAAEDGQGEAAAAAAAAALEEGAGGAPPPSLWSRVAGAVSGGGEGGGGEGGASEARVVMTWGRSAKVFTEEQAAQLRLEAVRWHRQRLATEQRREAEQLLARLSKRGVALSPRVATRALCSPRDRAVDECMEELPSHDARGDAARATEQQEAAAFLHMLRSGALQSHRRDSKRCSGSGYTGVGE